jgi:hypothetical protein
MSDFSIFILWKRSNLNGEITQVYDNLQNWNIFPAVFVGWKALNKDHNAWVDGP